MMVGVYWLAGLIVAGVGIYLLGAWAQRRGWVNFRAAGSGLTAGAVDAGRFLDPPTEHVKEAREVKPPRPADDADPPTSPTSSAPRPPRA